MSEISFLQVLQDPIFVIGIILVACGIGIVQGHILGRAVLKRFPKLQNHAKVVSISLFFLFLVNAILSVPRFASPEKIALSKIFEAASSGEIASIIFTVLGVNTGFLAVLAISVTIVSLMLLRSTQMSGISKSFVMFFSFLILGVTIFSRFTEYTPNAFEVFLYFVYQLGITIGIVEGSGRKIKVI